MHPFKMKGFTFFEVLIALFLVSLITLLFFNQYWQINHLLNRIILKNEAFNYLNNSCERIKGHMKIKKSKKFQMQELQKDNGAFLIISCTSLPDKNIYHLQRQVVLNEK